MQQIFAEVLEPMRTAVTAVFTVLSLPILLYFVVINSA